MKTVTIKGNVRTVLGERLANPIEFEFKHDVFSEKSEIVSAGKWPSEDEIVEMVAAAQIQTARQNKVLELTEIERERIQNSPEYKRSQLVKQIRAGNAKISLEKAEAMADSILAAEG